MPFESDRSAGDGNAEKRGNRQVGTASCAVCCGMSGMSVAMSKVTAMAMRPGIVRESGELN